MVICYYRNRVYFIKVGNLNKWQFFSSILDSERRDECIVITITRVCFFFHQHLVE